ncbi:MAG TPA: peroxiredoxin [Holophaga sp.]|nr:peroxiredoxin [Holophaga sp.]
MFRSSSARMLAPVLFLLGLPVPCAQPGPGAKAPDFEAVDQEGRTIRLSDYLGRSSVVLYFYPKDDTPGCTQEACALRDGYAKLREAGAVVLGVSADDAASHAAFAAKFHLPFPLLADPSRTIIEAYGVRVPVLGIAKRVTFIIDSQGVIRRVVTHVDTARHDQEVLELLRAL